MTGPSPPLRVAIQGDIGEAFRQALTEDVDLNLTPTLLDDDVVPILADADVWISKRFTARMAESANRLKLIQTIGAGTNEIDFDAVPPGTTVCNVGGHEVGVAEHVMMCMLALIRDLTGMNERMHRGNWQDRFQAPPKPELRGKTVAIIGLGRIGAEIARLSRAFGMHVTGVTRQPNSERATEIGLEYLGGIDDLHRILPTAQFVVAGVPLDEDTTGMIGADEFTQMNSSGFLINIARGHVVDEAALYEALRNRTIAGAAIDVWYQYPAADEQLFPSIYPIHELDNVIMTPHVAGWTDGTFEHRWAQINENLRRLTTDEPLLNVVASTTDDKPEIPSSS